MSDWMPGARTEILAMCRNWISYMTPELRTAWRVPEAEFTALGTLDTNAQALLQKAMDEAERTHVITVECQAAFTALKENMWFFRDRFSFPGRAVLESPSYVPPWPQFLKASGNFFPVLPLTAWTGIGKNTR
jgi:hypothetical protein